MTMKDRGLLKWQPFIMPEQRALLKQAYIESLKIEKPVLDEGHFMKSIIYWSKVFKMD
jgi:hypothetical protein